MCVLTKDIPRGSSKYLSYSDVMKKFKPVFHHFFMEKFPSPPQWFERRLAYTRSVAASSIGKFSCYAARISFLSKKQNKNDLCFLAINLSTNVS